MKKNLRKSKETVKRAHARFFLLCLGLRHFVILDLCEWYWDRE